LAAVAAALSATLVGLLIVELFLRPAVSTTPAGVVLVNPFRTVVVPWAAVRAVKTEYALQILTDHGGHTSWAATGRRGSSVLVRGLRGSRQTGPPSVTQLLWGSGAGGGVPAPVECWLFIEAGLGEWQAASARTTTSARGSEPRPRIPPTAAHTTGGQAADATAGDSETPAAPSVTWHGRWALAVAVLAALLLGVTVAL
jgi:hypothetical protein